MGDKFGPVKTRSSFKPSEETIIGLVSLIESTFVNKALLDTEWILAMQVELNQLSINDMLNLVPRPKVTYVIGIK